jgi:phosphatidylglycerophosphatase A
MEDTSARPNPADSSIPLLPRLIATGLFSGYSPFAPGTAGSLVGLILYGIPGMDNPIVLSSLIVVFFGLGVPSAATVAHIVGDQLTQGARTAKALFQPGSVHAADPSIVVIDEVVGMWVSLLFLPKSIVVAAIAFLAFRLFDIIKPFPAKQIERYPNGWGIMLDDIAAGIYANIGVRILLVIFPALAGV